MTIARKHIVCLENTPYYHVIGRCVRRAFLCGVDSHSGKDYEHRRQWIVDRLAKLAEIFAIDVCAFAVMSNHYHLVVRLAPRRGRILTDDEVLARWGRLYGIPTPICLGLQPEAAQAQRELAMEMIQARRERLADLGWFMKCLNEYIARKANAEHRCTGAFWEGRYKSQALLDERALLTCMAYADLNPIRAGMSESLERSDYTSVQQRIRALQGSEPLVPLAPFRDETKDSARALPIRLRDYLELVDWSGRVVLPNKRGAIPDHLDNILDRIGFDEDRWLRGCELQRRPLLPVLGPAAAIRRAASALGRHWFRGVSECRVVFGP